MNSLLFVQVTSLTLFVLLRHGSLLTFWIQKYPSKTIFLLGMIGTDQVVEQPITYVVLFLIMYYCVDGSADVELLIVSLSMSKFKLCLGAFFIPPSSPSIIFDIYFV